MNSKHNEVNKSENTARKSDNSNNSDPLASGTLIQNVDATAIQVPEPALVIEVETYSIG